MTVRVALFSILMLVGTAAAALAQNTGSLTLMSRPSGASFKLEGDVVVVGRTPMTFDRGLAGHFKLTGFEVGYQNWSRSLQLDGVSADTVWFTLQEKSGVMAGVRSLLLPGWGQLYDEHRGRAIVFLVGELAAGAGVGVAEWRYRDRRDDLDAAVAAYQAALATPGTADDAAPLATKQYAQGRFDDAKQLRRILFGAVAGVVGLSVIDAVVGVPRPVGTILLGASVRRSDPASRGGYGNGAVYAMTLARVRF
jgi:hypothetical protein